MRAVVLIPKRGGGEWRERNFKVVHEEAQRTGLEVFVADSGDEPFSVARSYNLAASMAGEWDKAVLMEADGWVRASQIHQAIDADHPGLTYAWNQWIKLSRSGTQAFWKGQREDFQPAQLRKKQWGKNPPLGAGPRVVTRALWQAVAGFDERFVGWGPEDQDFAHRCERVTPHIRIEGVGYDLWHPMAPRDHHEANRAIFYENNR